MIQTILITRNQIYRVQEVFQIIVCHILEQMIGNLIINLMKEIKICIRMITKIT